MKLWHLGVLLLFVVVCLVLGEFLFSAIINSDLPDFWKYILLR